MAVIKIEAKKDTRCTQTICLIRGDRRTQILRFGVNRYDGGVDLSDLAWVIKTVNANGVEDVFDPEAVEIGESRITVDWLVEGSVTDADGLAKYELNGLDTVGEDVVPVIWRGGTGTISLRADISPKFGESDGMTNIEKLILYVDGELQNVIDAGSAAADAAARANRAADNVEDLSGAVERANAAAQRATDAAAAVEDLEGAVTRANSAAALATDGAMSADVAASMAYSAATRATEAAKNVENIEEATVAAYDAADDARMAAEVANAAGLPAAMIYGRRVMGETAKATGNSVSFLPDAGSLLQPVTVLEPQQEGSGDPYPAGGGKNLFNYDAWKTVNIEKGTAVWENNGVTITSNEADCFTGYGSAYSEKARIPVSEGNTYVLSWDESSNKSGNVYIFPNGSSNGMVSTNNSREKKLVYTATSGIFFLILRFGVSNAGETIAYKNIQIEKGSTATEFQPYSNIRPFIGYDKLGLGAAGKNLLDSSLFPAATTQGISFEPQENGVKVSGTATGYANTRIEGFALPVGTYLLSMSGASGVSVYLRRYFSDGTNETVYSGNPITIDGSETQINIYLQVNTGNTVDGIVFPLLRLASDTDATYEPYAGKLHTVQIGQTVYGIRYEWLTGKAAIEWVLAKGVFTRATLDSSDKLYSIKGIPSTVKPYPTSQEGLYEPYIVCTALLFKALEAARRHGKPCITQYGTEIYIGGFVGREAELDALIASDDFAVAYKLATPIEIQLTPHIISAADPEQTNTLYGDGSIEVEYVKPLHVSIEERVAAALAAAAE